MDEIKSVMQMYNEYKKYAEAEIEKYKKYAETEIEKYKEKVKNLENELNKTQYLVVSYYNYRKEMCMRLHGKYEDEQEAIDKAYELASYQYNEDEIVEEVEDNYLQIYDCVVEYTSGNGYGEMVYCVLNIG